MSRNKSKQKRKTSNWANKQIDQKVRLIKTTSRLIDLGAAPGSWSQYAAKKVGPQGQILAVDLLPMEQVPGVQFIQGDFTDPEVIDEIRDATGGEPLNLVLSDMAPNITGIRATDQARIEVLQEAILGFWSDALTPGGLLLTKLFEGEAAVEMRKRAKTLFKDIQVMKPDASRSESKEVFLLASGYKSQKN